MGINLFYPHSFYSMQSLINTKSGCRNTLVRQPLEIYTVIIPLNSSVQEPRLCRVVVAQSEVERLLCAIGKDNFALYKATWV